jgi:hypothetical protein
LSCALAVDHDTSAGVEVFITDDDLASARFWLASGADAQVTPVKGPKKRKAGAAAANAGADVDVENEEADAPAADEEDDEGDQDEDEEQQQYY